MRIDRVRRFTLMVMLLMAGPLRAQPARLFSDEEIAELLRGRLAHLEIENLHVDVLGRMVTLKGTADSLGKKKEGGAIALKAPGISEVSNEIEVVDVGDDPGLERAVLAELEKDPHYTVYDEVEASVNGGRLVLEGRVGSEDVRQAIADDLAKVRGVRDIENRIRLLPYSLSDLKLQEAVVIDIADALLKAGRPGLPVHVVVENARVTLTGVVGDELTRRVAEETARRTEGVRSVDNRIEVAPRRGSTVLSEEAEE